MLRLSRFPGFQDGIHVEERLGGMLVGPVSGIDDRDGGNLCGIAGGAFQGVAHHNQVGVVGHHLDGVVKEFLLW